jgi:hypothetical protein
MTKPDPNSPTCFEAFHELSAQKQWELYRNAIQQQDAARIDRDDQRKGRDSWVEEAERLTREIHRQRVKLANRGAFIVELKGEFRDGPLGDPAARSWACLWCGEMLTGRDHAKQHCEVCPESPLVKRIQSLEQQLHDPKAPWNNA